MVAQIDKRFSSLSFKKTFTRYVSYLFYEGRPLTTKGRWFNLFVFLGYAIQRWIPASRSVKSPVFIVGTGRSGTTILGVTLGIHDDVGFLNEPKALWSYVCSKDDLIGSYRSEVGSYFLNASDSDDEMKRKIKNIYGCYLKMSGSSRIVDKYPEMIFRYEFVKSIFPDAKFLFLHRNGWDTCDSIKKWSERLGVQHKGEVHDWWGVDGRKWSLLCEQVVSNDKALSPCIDEIKGFKDHISMAAVEWIVSMKEGLSLVEKNPEDVMPVSYEKYVSSSGYRKAVLDFCGLGDDENYRKYCNSVLKASPEKKSVDLPESIRSEFMNVMNVLGYE